MTDPEIVSQGPSPAQLKVTYSLRIVPHGDPGTRINFREERDKGRLGDWDSILLHIPKTVDFPRRLAAVVPAGSLVPRGAAV